MTYYYKSYIKWRFVLLPDFLQIGYFNYKRTPNPFQRFHKIINFSLSLLKTYTTIIYCHIRYTEIRNQKIEKYIFDNFQRPTEGAWYSFLEILITAKFDNNNDPRKYMRIKLNDNYNKSFNDIYKYAFNLSENITFKNTIFDSFQKIITLKNRLISHGIVSEELALKFNPTLENILDEIINNTDELLNTKLYLITDFDNGTFKVCNFIDNKQINIDTSNIKDEGLYFYINNRLIPTWPLVACRDGNILFYNRYDKDNQKIFFTNNISHEVYIRSEAISHSEIFGFDNDLIDRKPLNIQIKVEKNVTHNLPEKDYAIFIGRNKEIENLNIAIEHPRHFISALDGIGGVGKSAIAIECCNRIINNINNSYEYIIWVSAKSTVFRDGKIINIEQAFDHLEQLIDTILIVLGFSEYLQYEYLKKKKVVIDLLSCTKILLVLDNLETIKPGNFAEIWNFINNDFPSPSKILLTSREFPESVPQTIRVENLSEEDSLILIEQYSKEIGILHEYINSIKKDIYSLSSGLPIVIRSILGQIKLGKKINAIKKEIENNTDNISKFCFEQQLILLNIDQKTVLLTICLASDVLDHDALSYIISDLLSISLLEIVKDLSSFSIIKINYLPTTAEYTILPLIKNYILFSNIDVERREEIKKRLNDFYELKNVENYTLLPIEEKVIDRGSLIPRKIVDKAMQTASYGDFDQAEIMFKKAVKDYEREAYVWYMYSQFYAQYKSDYHNAINCLKKAYELTKNYIYPKKMGDYNLKNRNYRAAVLNYKEAFNSSTLDKNKSEMLYLIACAEYEQVRQLRRAIRNNRNEENINERNNLYQSVINNLEEYSINTPHIYDGKLIKIYRMLSEAYYGLHNNEKALMYIEKAIDLSEYDDTHVDFRSVILGNRI
jgi:tetratricopeptide (TPR) repeat protein